MNRLTQESSPYLLQHAHNPVDWYAWGPEAFERAAAEDKPVFLSIGYSTCHWCHVMERESFENPDVAKILNEHFISVKVDREQRPDIDQVYMSYVTSVTGSGGWPMSVFLTPDKKPFYGGTYFPPEDAHRLPGFGRLLRSIAESWAGRRSEILEAAESAATFLSAKDLAAPKSESLDWAAIQEKAFRDFSAMYDEGHAGFGQAPKFPRSHALIFLLRYGARCANADARRMALDTLAAMARGGIQDQLGGGFHRYSTDRLWRIPHFEKMLYDQALLASAYAEGFWATGEASLGKTARQTLDYVLESMRSPSGAFYSAEDADSVDSAKPDHKREGAFFVWTQEEVVRILGPETGDLFCAYYGIQKEGNAPSDPHGEFENQNTLYEALSLKEAAENYKKTASEIDGLLEESRKKLLAYRATRPRPERDEKILTDWNALMIGALAQAARRLGEDRYRDAAVEAMRDLEEKLSDGNGRWQHSFFNGRPSVPAQLQDLAYLAEAMMSLYEATLEESWLAKASQLAETMLKEFEDVERGGFYSTSQSSERLIFRPKDSYDGALPSGNSAAVLALARLSCFVQNERYSKAALRAAESCAEFLSSDPTQSPVMLMALDWIFGKTRQVKIMIGRGESDAAAWVQEASKPYYPWQTILMERSDAAKTTAVLCQGRVCGRPIESLEALVQALDGQVAAG